MMVMKILLLLLLTVVIIIKSQKSLHMLQQNLYNENNRYLKWMISHSSNLISIEFIIFLIIFLAYSFWVEKKGISLVLNVVAFFLYLNFILRYYKIQKESPVKKPLVYTARIKRLIVTTTIVYFLPLLFFFLTR